MTKGPWSRVVFLVVRDLAENRTLLERQSDASLNFHLRRGSPYLLDGQKIPVKNIP